MLQNLELLKQLKNDLQEATPRIEGQIKATEKSYGFLETDKGKSYFVPPPQMRKVLHGDRVQARLVIQDGKESVEPEALTEPALIRFIGKVSFFKEKLQVMPEHHLLNRALDASVQPPLNKKAFQEGDWVVALLEKHALRDGKFRTCIVQRIAAADDPGLPWLVSLARHKLPADAPVTEQSLQPMQDETERLDLTHLPLVTIDSASTRDMDDALFAEVLPDQQGWLLTVAIADPSSYIAPDSELDQVAQQRGYTTYLPGRNIPMLPRVLSDELCSLHPNQERSVLCCQMRVNSDGSLNHTPDFILARIRSRAKLSYDDVSDWLETGSHIRTLQELDRDTEDAVLRSLQALAELSKASFSRRLTDAVVFPDRPDYRFRFDAQGEVYAIIAEYRRSAHKLVEEAMILANTAAGHFLRDHDTGIFNTQSGFDSEKLDEVVQIVSEQGYDTDRDRLASLSGYAAFRRQLMADQNLWLDSRLRRYQGYVLTRPEATPHYGMGLEAYATWTSPIRKYSDLINHRLIKQLISGQAPDKIPEELGEQLDQCRLSSRLAERDTCNWLYIRFLKSAVEEKTVFTGEIFDISRGGIRVRLEENGATPFIPGSLLHKERKEMTLDNNSGQVFIQKEVRYRLGDRVRVQLIKADETRRSLMAQPYQEPESTADQEPTS